MADAGVRTRFIDEMMERAVGSGAKQLVILGAGFDTRAHRFAELLRNDFVRERSAACCCWNISTGAGSNC
jgi:hypothetical protein